MTAPRAIHFADPLPAPTFDQPAAERCIGAPPQRTTWELYEQQGISMGLWACEPGAWKIAFHAHRHEFFQVLEGRLRLITDGGEVREYGPGDAAIIPAGFKGIFEVLETVRKRYVMVDQPATT